MLSSGGQLDWLTTTPRDSKEWASTAAMDVAPPSAQPNLAVNEAAGSSSPGVMDLAGMLLPFAFYTSPNYVQ